MTLEERVAALEMLVAKYEAFFTFGSFEGIPYVKTAGRVGVMTEFWCKQPIGKGAALSVGTAIDRFAGYFEVDECTCSDAPTTGVYAAVVAPNNANRNLAFEAHAENAPRGNMAFYGDVQYAPQNTPPLTPIEIGEMSGGVIVRTRTIGFE